MNWRLASRLSVVTLAILVVILVSVFHQRQANSATNSHTASKAAAATGLQGTDLGKTSTQDFRLTDQNGKQVSLSQFRGKPVVLTFLYTNCPDQCPLTAEKLHATQLALGKNAANAAMIAVSVDPQRDNVAAALKFSTEHNLHNSWHYLVGNHSQLQPIWKEYHVEAATVQNAQTIDHSLGLYVIDKQGRERVYFDPDFTPAQLAHDLQVLSNE
ncbi:MAG TPA: SCO family protein [Ktedonobacteraceae bacterium]|jgi:protein SCO1/2|nr:SCO family protein [Ktedonobacteraceae bacterium]